VLATVHIRAGSWQGRGLVREALDTLIAVAFSAIGLHDRELGLLHGQGRVGDLDRRSRVTSPGVRSSTPPPA